MLQSIFKNRDSKLVYFLMVLMKITMVSKCGRERNLEDSEFSYKFGFFLGKNLFQIIWLFYEKQLKVNLGLFYGLSHFSVV